MKSIINGKRYDTDTATEIGKYWNGCSSGDFNNCTEGLYLTKGGSWFIAGHGGPMSSYAESCEGGRGRTGGSAIRPLTAAEARQWLEDHGETEALEKHFASEITDA